MWVIITRIALLDPISADGDELRNQSPIVSHSISHNCAEWMENGQNRKTGFYGEKRKPT